MMKGGDRGEDRLSFILPSFPPSINRLYEINHRQRRVFLSDSALLWRTQTTPFIKPCRWPAEWLLAIELDYQSPNWLYKNGSLRRADVQNLDKLVIDTLFLKWQTDDSRLVERLSRKTYGDREQIVVTLTRALTALALELK